MPTRPAEEVQCWIVDIAITMPDRDVSDLRALDQRCERATKDRDFTAPTSPR